MGGLFWSGIGVYMHRTRIDGNYINFISDLRGTYRQWCQFVVEMEGGHFCYGCMINKIPEYLSTFG